MNTIGYINTTDTWMSGSAQVDGKINRCTVPFCNAQERDIILSYLRTREDQKNIRVSKVRPHSTDTTMVTESRYLRITSAKWYLRTFKDLTATVKYTAMRMIALGKEFE